MTAASQLILQVLEYLVKVVPVGTNRALLQLMWAIVSGAFLPSRGAVHSALQQAGFAVGEIRRSWQALRYGVWSNEELLCRWRRWVRSETNWQPNQYEGWQPLAIDMTTFWRPRLQGWVGRGYHQLAQRLLPGVVFGVVVQVGNVARQRVPLLRKLIRADPQATDTEAALKQQLLLWTRSHLGATEVVVCDAGVELKQMQAAGVPRYVLRLARNCTVRRNELPTEQRRGRPREYGQLLRPLPRRYRGKLLAASEPDVCGSFTEPAEAGAAAVTVHFQGWHEVVRADQKVAADNQTVTVWTFVDPRFRDPLVLGTNLPASAAAIYHLFADRWPVEQLPLVAKQMLGLHRHFVFAPTSVWRLPELALLLGNVLTLLTTLLPPMPSGYWDRHPKKRPAACDAYWHRPLFQTLTHWTAGFAKKPPARPTCRRVFRPIAAFRVSYTATDRLSQPHFGPHC
jgi:hypothetical protein